MCWFKAYLYMLCGHADYVISVPCIRSKRQLLPNILSPDILAAPHYKGCIPCHADPGRREDGNIAQMFVITPDEIGPLVGWGSSDTAESDNVAAVAGFDEETFFRDYENASNTPLICGLCSSCTAAAQQLIEMHQTRPCFGLAEDMVLDDDVALSTDDGYQESGFHGDYNTEAETLCYEKQKYLLPQASYPIEEQRPVFDDYGFPLVERNNNNNIINAGMTAQPHFPAQIDTHNPWANGYAVTPNAYPPINNTTSMWNDRNFVKNHDLLDDPFAIHGDSASPELPVKYNSFLSNVMRVMDDEDSNSNNYLARSRLNRTHHTTNLPLRPKKRKRKVTFDLPSTSPPRADTSSAGELPHQDKRRRRTSTVPDDCPYALRSRPSFPLTSGL